MAEECGCKTVCWGSVIAGAAIVTGALLLVPVIAPELGSTIGSGATGIADTLLTGVNEVGKMLFAGATDIGTMIYNAVHGISAPSAPTFFTKEVVQGLTGAALLGGGTAAYMNIKPQEAPDPEELMLAHQKESFSEREDMRRAQSLLRAKIASQSPQYAQAYMGAGAAQGM